MRMNKKLLCIVLLCCLFVGNIPVSASNPENDCQAVTILKGLGVIDDSFKSETYITRAEFVAFALKAMNKNLMLTEEVPYTDVDKSNMYYTDISTACKQGYIVKAEKFRPDDEIIYEEAAKILVCILGWECMVDMNGGYVNMARSLGLFDNLSYRAGAKVSGAEGATMIRNAFESYYMDMVDIKSNTANYKKSENLYMNEYLEIYKDKGILTNNGLISLDGNDFLDGMVKIGGQNYYVGACNVSAYFGQEIIYYYKQAKGDDTGTLLYAEPTNRNTVYEIQSFDINEKTTTTEFCYDDGDKIKRLAISPDVTVLYNGRAEFAYTREMLMPETGTVKLIDLDSDRRIDTIVSYNYSIGVVKSFNESLNRLVMKFNAPQLCFDDYNHIQIIRDGREITASELNEWDVVNSCVTDDRLFIVVSDKVVSGNIEKITTYNGRPHIVVDGNRYCVSKSYISDSGKLETGERGVFYTDINGEIICVNYSTTSRRNYCILIKAVMDETDSDIAWFKFYTKDDTTEMVKSARKVKINRESCNPEEAVSLVESIGLYQLVVCDTNEKGEVVSIDFAEDKTNVSNYKGYDNDKFTLDKKIAEGQFYNNVTSGCMLSKDLIFFDLPKDRTNINLYTTSDYKRVWGQNLTIKNLNIYDLDKFNRPGCIVVTDYDENILPGQENVDVSDTRPFVVSDIYVTINEDDEIRTKLCGWIKGAYQEYWIAEGGAHNVSNFMVQNGSTRMANPIPNNDRTMWGFVGHQHTDIHKGDIMQLGFNAKNEVEFYRMFYAQKEKGTDISITPSGTWGGDITYISPGEYYEVSENPGNAADPRYMSMCYTAYGEIIDVEGDYFRYKTVLTHFIDGKVVKYPVERAFIPQEVYIMDCASKDAVVKKASSSDMMVGDKIFVYGRDNTCFTLMLIR